MNEIPWYHEEKNKECPHSIHDKLDCECSNPVKNTAVSRWIEDARKGGYKGQYYSDYTSSVSEDYIEGLLLERDFWEAVGRTRNWTDEEEGTFESTIESWQAHWTDCFENIKNGKDIEQALTAIE